MTAAALLQVLRARGVDVVVVGNTVRFRPASRVTEAERACIRARKLALLALLSTAAPSPANTPVPPKPTPSRRADPSPDDEITDDVPDGPCRLCESPLSWTEHWPTAGAHGWRCLRCLTRPIPTLREVYQTLTPDERRRLEAEAAGGDDRAREVLNQLAVDEDEEAA